MAVVRAEGTTGRFCVDGTTATASVGVLMKDLQSELFTGIQLANLSCFLPSGTNASVEYFKRIR